MRQGMWDNDTQRPLRLTRVLAIVSLFSATARQAHKANP